MENPKGNMSHNLKWRNALWAKGAPLVQVLWRNCSLEEATYHKGELKVLESLMSYKEISWRGSLSH